VCRVCRDDLRIVVYGVLHHGAQDGIDRFGGRGGNLPGYGRDESLHVGPGYGSHAPVAEQRVDVIAKMRQVGIG
jgi:hypothetical protein